MHHPPCREPALARRIPLGVQRLAHTGGARSASAIPDHLGDDWTARCDECEEPQEATANCAAPAAADWVTGKGVMPLTQAFGLLCGPDLVRQWHHRRRIEGRIVNGVTWYDLASVQRYVVLRTARRDQGATLAGPANTGSFSSWAPPELA
ncbi:hypothetical protein [Actinomadura rifamycini]|uniref:hypothetical protein n=1 Tax=Actinomadura rifamycini TaxID=31962 RepID=UPI000479B1AE|nr:hypothetical protein [Actinomadura rifamycini]